jgi:hypothetical protein
MSTRPDIDDAQAELIDQRIGQAFAFLRDVLSNPSLVEKIPSGATLRHRDVALEREHVVVRLTAFLAPEMPAGAATITGATGGPQRWGDITTWHVHRPNGQRMRFEAVGETADGALDALETQLRRAVEVEALPG